MNDSFSVYRCSVITCALVALLAFPSALHAVLPVISSGEISIFSDDFTDNANNWTAVSVVNGSGTATSATASIDNGVWSPAFAGDKTAVNSVYHFDNDINVLNGPISLYMRVRVDETSKSDGSRFSITMDESTGSRFVRLQVRPAASGSIEYRDNTGGGASTETTSIAFSNASTFYDFKVTLTPGSDLAEPASAEAFYYDTDLVSYVSIGSASNLVYLNTGIFDRITINSRNDGAAYFDSVAITTAIPEPSNAAVLAGGLVLLSVLTRRHRRGEG